MVLPHPLVKLSIMGSLHDREVACSPSDLQGLDLEFKFSLYVHKSGLKPDSFNFIYLGKIGWKQSFFAIECSTVPPFLYDEHISNKIANFEGQLIFILSCVCEYRYNI